MSYCCARAKLPQAFPPTTEIELDGHFAGVAFCECSKLAATRRPPCLARCLPLSYFHLVKSGNFYEFAISEYSRLV